MRRYRTYHPMYILVALAILEGCGGEAYSETQPDTVDNYDYCQALAEEPALTQKQAQKWNQLDCAEVLSAPQDD